MSLDKTTKIKEELRRERTHLEQSHWIDHQQTLAKKIRRVVYMV